MAYIRWKEFSWNPQEVPDFETYQYLRSMDEAAFRVHLDELARSQRKELDSRHGYHWRPILWIFGGALLVFLVGLATKIESLIMPALLVIVLLIGPAYSVSQTKGSYDEVIHNQRQFTLKCWIAANKLDYDRFYQHIRYNVIMPP